MIGVPKIFNTKEDILTCHALALAGEIDGLELKNKLQNLFADKNVWTFKAEVTDTYIPKDGEQVTKDTDPATGTEKYTCFALASNANAGFLLMGFTETELNNLIEEL